MLTFFGQIDLNECHLTKVLADFAGHYMRPDLIRLLVDTRRKELEGLPDVRYLEDLVFEDSSRRPETVSCRN